MKARPYLVHVDFRPRNFSRQKPTISRSVSSDNERCHTVTSRFLRVKPRKPCSIVNAHHARSAVFLLFSSPSPPLSRPPQASKNLALRTLAAWRATADLQAARRAVFHARVSTAAGVLAGGKLRRALDRWREFHDSSRVTLITRLRAEGHAQRKILGKFWRAWVAARDVQVCL